MFKKNLLLQKLTAAASAAALTAASVTGTVMPVSSAAGDPELDNYAKLLQYSLYFFDANYCGSEAGEKSHFSWRDDCHTGDVVHGGFHDAGDHIICGLTEGFTASTIGWMYYEYADEFKKTGTDAHFKDISDHFAEFFRNSTTLSDGAVSSLVYEIGDDGRDHAIWQNAELMWDHGADESYSTTNGASNVAAQYAAALAQSYINFGNEEDLTYAKALYDFAAKNRTITHEQSTYEDKSAEDDIAWAAGWLYLATNEQTYLDANSKDTSGTNNWTNDYYYGGVWLGAAIINAEITGNWSAPVNYISGVTNVNRDQFYVMNSWGSARHNTLMQTCALVATKHKDESGADFSEWCKKQMNMILGENNANVCLVVGYNDIAATSPHHRSASNLNDDNTWSKWNSWDGNYASVSGSHTLYGALCGGPTSDDFTTFRKLDAKDATSNEVALDYQAGLVGAAAGLYAIFGTGNVVADIGEGVTVYDSEKAAANGETPPQTTTTTTTAATTTTVSETTTTITTTKPEYDFDLVCDKLEIEVGEKVQVGIKNYDSEFRAWSDEISSDCVELEYTYPNSFNVVGVKSGEAVVTITYKGVSKSLTFIVKDSSSGIVYGDANCDDGVNMADAVLIMQSQSNPDKYGLNGSEESHITSQGELNGDVYENGSGITSQDALSIQKFMLNLIDELPESYKN